MVSISTETPGSRKTGRAERLLPVGLGLGVILVAFGAAFYPSIEWMASEWSASSGALSHGYLVAAISGALFLRAIPDVAAADMLPAWWLLPVVLGLSVVWLLGYVATVVAVQTVLLPAILLAAVFAAYGFKASRPLAFAILFAYFAVPAWDHLNFIFQHITVFVVGALIRVTGIPALLYGNFVELSSGTFEIAGGCSGLSFVIAGLSLAVLYGHLYYKQVRHSAMLIAMTLLMAMIGNWIRVYGIIVIGYRSNMQSPLVDDHLTLGWVLFGLLLVPVFLIARHLEDRDASTALPGRRDRVSVQGVGTGNWLAVGCVVLAMISGPIWANTIAMSDVEAEGLQLSLPARSGRWSGPVESHWDWAPRYAGATADTTARYGDEDAFVLVYANIYLRQSQDKELVYFSNTPAGSWRTVALKGGAQEPVVTVGGQQFRQLTARNYAGIWRIWYRYQIGDGFVVDDVRAKMTQALQTLKGRPEAGVIAFAALCSPACDLAEGLLADFVNDFGHSIDLNDIRGGK